MQTIDLNCDLGEGYPDDAELLDHVSSANIACGFHAGDPSLMRATAEMAIAKGVAIGAHPSFFDRENFGRRPMELPFDEVVDLVLYQIGAIKSICEAHGGRLTHVKPHGALYNMAAVDGSIADAIASAVAKADRGLILYGLAGSRLIEAGKKLGLRTAAEAFADRTYRPDGTLTPRGLPNAVITDPERSIAQAISIALDRTVLADDRTTVPVAAETICIHGDTPGAVDFAARIRSALVGRGISIRPLNSATEE